MKQQKKKTNHSIIVTEDSQDALHELNIKLGVTSHFAKTLKTLQQKHLQADGEEFIYRSVSTSHDF